MSNFDPKEVEEALIGKTTEPNNHNEQRYTISFINGQPGLVVREDSPEALKSSLKAVLPIFKSFRNAVEVGQANKSEAPKTNEKRVACEECGAPMEYKSGFSKTKNKNWEGYFCTADKDHKPMWL